MAISTYHSSSVQIELSEFIDFVESEICVSDPESVIQAAPMLEALAQNKKLLLDTYNRDLKSLCSGSYAATYSPSSAVLGRGRSKKFIVRANLWPSIAESPSRTIEEMLFSYNTAHDHNFDFLTANYFGPGYETEIWQYADRKNIEGFAGEKLELEFLERTNLHRGKQIFYRRCRDIHIQFPPTSFSASINLMAPTELDIITDQYYFDLEQSTLAGHPDGCPASRRVHLFEIAGQIGNEDTVDVLAAIAVQHPCQRTRAAALEGAICLSGDSSSLLNQRVRSDRSHQVKAVVAKYS